MSDKLKNLDDLFQHEIRDIYSAEKQIMEALPKMKKAANDERLKQAFEDHLEETRKQKERIEQIGEICDFDVSGEECEAAKGLIKEGDQMIHEDAEDYVKDAGLIAAAQRIEHYEMAVYGTLRHYAKRLGYDEVEKLLNDTLEEEKKADKTLNEIAISNVNAKAETEAEAEE